jgi:hypothetical protein
MVVKRDTNFYWDGGLGLPGIVTVARRDGGTPGGTLRMAKRALVTGSPKRLEEVGAALEAAGFEVLQIEGLEALQRLGENLELEPRSLDSYVQLPVDIHAEAKTVTGQIEALLQHGILLRYRCAEAVLPLLAPDAHVVLVPGNLPPQLSAPDDHQARVALLRVLAHTLRADRAPEALSVTVASSDYSPRELASIAQGYKVEHRVESPPDYANLWPDMDYDDWRLAVLSLASLEG